MVNPRHSSVSVEYFTPMNIVEAARALMGGIDLDPATSALGNKERVKAERFYDEKTNGFAKKWNGRVFLNPPGGRCDEEGRAVAKGGKSSVKQWWTKLASEYDVGHVSQAIFIGFSIELLQSGQLVSSGMPPTDFPICIPKRRIAFDLAVGKEFIKGNSPTHANCIVYLPRSVSVDKGASDIERFGEWFGDVGAIMIPRV